VPISPRYAHSKHPPFGSTRQSCRSLPGAVQLAPRSAHHRRAVGDRDARRPSSSARAHALSGSALPMPVRWMCLVLGRSRPHTQSDKNDLVLTQPDRATTRRLAPAGWATIHSSASTGLRTEHPEVERDPARIACLLSLAPSREPGPFSIDPPPKLVVRAHPASDYRSGRRSVSDVRADPRQFQFLWSHQMRSVTSTHRFRPDAVRAGAGAGHEVVISATVDVVVALDGGPSGILS
jgi:hypothetical protein